MFSSKLFQTAQAEIPACRGLVSKYSVIIDLEEGDSAKYYPSDDLMIYLKEISSLRVIFRLIPPSGGRINDILYRKLKASKLRIENLPHTLIPTEAQRRQHKITFLFNIFVFYILYFCVYILYF